MRFFAPVGLNLFLLLGCARLAGADLPALWAERLASVVAVEFATETELERQVAIAYGTVADDAGTIILPPSALNPRATPEQLKDFRVYRPGEPATEYAAAEYLGPDPVTGWHFLHVAEAGRAGLRPITDFIGPAVRPEPQVGERVWGLGLRKKDEDFRPYLLAGEVSMVQSLPQRTAIALDEVAGPGLPVFDAAGVFVGLGAPGFGESYLMFARRGREPIVLMDPDETAAFRLRSEVLPYLARIPKSVHGRPLAWLGTNGLQPLDPEVAKFLKLENHSALVVSEVLAGSPAEQGGLQERDLILSIDGEPLPRLKPDAVLVAYIDREFAGRAPGTKTRLGVMRGNEQLELTIELGDAPMMPREAPRQYFDRLGWTARQFTYSDAVERRADPEKLRGVIAHFVKPSSAAATAGLRVDDWVIQIDGTDVTDFSAAAAQLAAIEQDTGRFEFILQVSRAGETSLLRIRLN